MDATAAAVSPTPSPSHTGKPTARARISQSPPQRSASPRPSTRAPSPTPTAKPTPEPTPTPKPTVSPTAKPAPTPTKKPTSTPKPSAPAKANPNTPAGVCGAGFKTVDSHGLGGATVYLLYNGAAGKNCVVTISKYVMTQKIRMSAVLQVKGGASGDDTGSYAEYAGPIRLAASKTCVIWGGGYGTSNWKSGWSHCG